MLATLQITSRTHLKRKEVDDVLGGEGSWDNVDKTDGAFSSYCL
jgi:DNA-directed RNA polymerase III subunit RPC11